MPKYYVEPSESATWVPSAEQMRFMVWELTPVDRRDPPYQKDLAAEIGVSEFTLSRWKALPQWQEYKNVFTMMKLNASIPAIINCLIDDLTDPDNWQARRDFIRYGMPFMGQAMLDPRIQAIQQADQRLIQGHSVEQVLAALPEEHLDSVIKALEDLGVVQPEQTEEQPEQDQGTASQDNPTLDYSQFTRTDYTRPVKEPRRLPPAPPAKHQPAPGRLRPSSARKL